MIDNLKERFNVTTGQVYATLYSAHIGIEKLKDRLHELSSFSGTLTIGFTELRISSLLLQYFLFDLPQRSAYAKGKALGVIQTREHISRLKSPAFLYVKRERYTAK